MSNIFLVYWFQFFSKSLFSLNLVFSGYGCESWISVLCCLMIFFLMFFLEVEFSKANTKWFQCFHVIIESETKNKVYYYLATVYLPIHSIVIAWQVSELHDRKKNLIIKLISKMLACYFFGAKKGVFSNKNHIYKTASYSILHTKKLESTRKYLGKKKDFLLNFK